MLPKKHTRCKGTCDKTHVPMTNVWTQLFFYMDDATGGIREMWIIEVRSSHQSV